MKTPEQKYLELIREQQSRRRWRFGVLIGAVALSLVIIVVSSRQPISVLALVGMWAAGFFLFYIARHADTIVAYFKTIHRFLRENDGTLNGQPPAPVQTNLTQDEASAFDDLVNRLKNS